MADLKKVFIYVKADESTNVTSLKNQIVTTSKTDYNDRIFFLADTEEIVTHGQVFGVSKETTNHLRYIDGALKKITGVEFDELTGAETFEIVDDTAKSTIAAYVAKKMTTVSAKVDSAVTVTPLDVNGHKNYEVAVVADELTVVTKAGKLTSGLQLVYANKQTTVDGIEAGHPSMYLADKAGTMVGTAVDVNDFIVDGMISSVEYVAQGEDGLPAIKITWNADGSNKVTYIPISTVFKLEEIHTGTKDYISVKKTTPTTANTPHPGDVDGGMCYEVNAVVDTTDLTVATTVTHTEGESETYTASIKEHADANNFADITGLADSVKVAAKFKATDELIATVANRAIERDKTLTAGIDEKIAKLQEALNKEVTDRTEGDVDLQTKIDEINFDSEDIVAHPTSVNAKIAKLRDSLTAELHAQDDATHPLVTVSLSQKAGKIKDLAVTTKIATLMSDTKLNNIDGQVAVGDKTYYLKDITEISKVDPSLVTIQDAWLYGQALMTTVKSDNNKYIKVENNAGKLMIQYEPWAEVHSANELNALYK
nr:MAG TPA: hypothetical protein [Ackermannviridae sp.]